MSQLDLFGGTTEKREAYVVARPSDPQTSQQAAEDLRPKLKGYHAEFVRRLNELGQATAQEVACGQESIRKRAKELVDRGMIRVCGVRKCTVTGKNATIYEVAK